MKKLIYTALALFCVTGMAAEPVVAQGRSSGRKAQERASMEIPRCSQNLGTIAVVEPDDK